MEISCFSISFLGLSLDFNQFHCYVIFVCMVDFKDIEHFRTEQKLKVHRSTNNLQCLQKVFVKDRDSNPHSGDLAPELEFDALSHDTRY